MVGLTLILLLLGVRTFQILARSDPDEGLNSLVGVLKSLNKNFETENHKVNPLPFKLDKFDGKTGKSFETISS